MKNETRIERLNATLYLASTVPPSRIDQGDWTIHNCNTKHCIAGWCGASPWHNKCGYTLEYDVWPTYNGVWGFRGFADFHGIEHEEAYAVTVENANLSGADAKRDVVRKLKALIRQYGGEVMYSEAP